MSTRTLTYQPACSEPRAPTPKPHLFRILHCDELLGASWRHELADVDLVRIKRSRAHSVRRHGCELELGLQDGHVSTTHAVLTASGGSFMLQDAGSKNGCFVNGQRVLRAMLRDGDVLRVGRTIFVFRSALPSSPGVPDVEIRANGPGLVTAIPELAHAFDRLVDIASSRATVLILGETGTGKEVAARAVHALSPEGRGFVPVNCAAIAPSLIASELFGHRRGAFTGAVGEQPGIFRDSDGGTLFLDEVVELPLAAQATILRAVQEGEIRAVGTTNPVRVSVRVVSATNADPQLLVEQGRFREDLFARLSGFTVRLPPLRERREDFGVIVSVILREHLVGQAPPALTPEAAERLLAYRWPRNIRELRAALVEAIATSRGGRVDTEHLPQSLRDASFPPAQEGAQLGARHVDDPHHRERLVEALRLYRGNLVRVAEVLKTSRTQIHRWARRYGISLESYRA
jgi:DNA-binding NtrC family response regulator